MIFKYLDLQGNADTKYTTYPLIPVLIFYKHQFIKTPIRGLIDSGSQHCYCNIIIGEYLRINFNKKKPIVSTAANGTKFNGFPEIVTLLASGKRIETRLIFSREMNPSFPLVLGQKNFFSNFEVCFNQAHNEFSLD